MTVIDELRDFVDEHEGKWDAMQSPWYTRLTKIVSEYDDEKSQIEQKYIEVIHLMSALCNFDSGSSQVAIDHFIKIIDEWAMNNMKVMFAHTLSHELDENESLIFDETLFLEQVSNI